jgi:hypothetical protein
MFSGAYGWFDFGFGFGAGMVMPGIRIRSFNGSSLSLDTHDL